MTQQVVSKKRIVDHGEVYTLDREVNAMLDLVKSETQRIESRFLEPACGTGNFLIEVLWRKLEVVASKYKKNQSEYERYTFLAVSSLYGIDILGDNIENCRKRLFDLVQAQYKSYYKKNKKIDFLNTIQYLLGKNILWGDALTMKTVVEPFNPIVFAEWSIVRGNLVKRRDFVFQELLPEESKMPLFSMDIPKSDEGDSVFIPTSLKDYPLCHFMKVADAK